MSYQSYSLAHTCKETKLLFPVRRVIFLVPEHIEGANMTVLSPVINNPRQRSEEGKQGKHPEQPPNMFQLLFVRVRSKHLTTALQNFLTESNEAKVDQVSQNSSLKLEIFSQRGTNLSAWLVWGPHPTVLRAYSWQCLGNQKWCLGSVQGLGRYKASTRTPV